MNEHFIKRFLKASISTSVGTFSSIFFHFLSIMILTRYVPKDEFGIYILILVMVHCITVLAGLGLDLTLVKFISGETANRKKGAFISIVVLRLVVLLFAAAIVYGCGYWFVQFFDLALRDFLVYLPVLFFLASFRDLFYNFFQGLELFKKYAGVQIFSAFLRFNLILAVLYFDTLSLNSLVVIEICTVLLTVLAQLICIPLNAIDTFRPSTRTLRSLIKFSLPLYLNNILTFLYDRINVVLIGAFLSPASMAYFEVAGKIPEGFLRMFKSFIVVYFPNQSKLFSKGEKQDAESLMNTSLFLFSFLFFFLVLFSFLFGNEIIGLIFSEKYLGVSLAFSLLMLNFSLRAISNLMGYSLVSAGYSEIPVKVNTVSSAVNITGALIMIPAFGYIGAVYSLLIMNVVSQIMHCVFLIRADIVPRIMQFIKPVFIAMLLIGIYFTVGNESVWVKLLIMTAYVGLSCLLIKDLRKVTLFLSGRRTHLKVRPGLPSTQ